MTCVYHTKIICSCPGCIKKYNNSIKFLDINSTIHKKVVQIII